MEGDGGPASGVFSVVENKAIDLIVEGMKPMYALREVGLQYKSRSAPYRRLTRAARSVIEKNNQKRFSICFLCFMYADLIAVAADCVFPPL